MLRRVLLAVTSSLNQPGAAQQRGLGTPRLFCGRLEPGSNKRPRNPSAAGAQGSQRCSGQRFGCGQESASKEGLVGRVSRRDFQSTWRPENAQGELWVPEEILEVCVCLTRVRGLSKQQPPDPAVGHFCSPCGCQPSWPL